MQDITGHLHSVCSTESSGCHLCAQIKTLCSSSRGPSETLDRQGQLIQGHHASVASSVRLKSNTLISSFYIKEHSDGQPLPCLMKSNVSDKLDDNVNRATEALKNKSSSHSVWKSVAVFQVPLPSGEDHSSPSLRNHIERNWVV